MKEHPLSNNHVTRQGARRSRGALWLIPLVLVAVAGGLFMTANSFRPHTRAAFAEALNNARQVKLALDGFAEDFGGCYPDRLTGRALGLEAYGFESSNDYFRQLFAAEETAFETLFWVKDSKLCGRRPDNRIRSSEALDPSRILAPGEVHWAYLTGQRRDGEPSRPLVMDSFLPGTTAFDPKLWDRKVIVVRIDSSTTGLRMRLDDDTIRDGMGKDLLSPEAEPWKGSGLDPRGLLVQPEPAPKGKNR